MVIFQEAFVFWVSQVTETELCSWFSEKATERNWEDATRAIKSDNISINSPDKIDGILHQSKAGTCSWHVPFPLYKALRAFLSPSRRSV